MKAKNKLPEEILIGLTIILVFTLYFFGALYELKGTTVLTPIAAALIIGGFLRVQTYRYLRNIHGIYDQHNLEGHPLPDKKTNVVFGLRNLLRFRPSILVIQKSDSKGNWESTINISGQNPLLSSGIYKYTKSGNSGGGVEGDWGLHELHINPEDEIIHVKAVSKGRQGADEYILKKVTNKYAV